MKRILNLLFITLGIQSIFYFIQSYLGITFRLTGEIFLENESIPRPGGTVSTNPAGFASYLTPTLLIGFALYLSRKQVLKIHFLSLLVLLGSAAMVLTFTRAVWAGLLLGLILVFFMTLRQHNYQRSRGSIILVTLLLAAIIFVPIMINKRLSTQYQDEGALEERIRLMRIAVNIIEANPIIGVGPGAYSHVYKNHLTPELNRGWLSEVHNEFLLRTAETGILGGIAFLLFLMGGLRQALRLTQSNNATVRVIAVGWFSSLVSLAWQMAWVPWRGFSYNAMLWLMLGLMEGIEKRLLNQET